MEKFKKNQIVWFISRKNIHLEERVCKGKFIGQVPFNHDYESTVKIEPLTEYHYDNEVLTNWVFATESEAEKEIDKILKRQIKTKEEEVEYLKKRVLNRLQHI